VGGKHMGKGRGRRVEGGEEQRGSDDWRRDLVLK
jgi:hypothetical protein